MLQRVKKFGLPLYHQRSPSKWEGADLLMPREHVPASVQSPCKPGCGIELEVVQEMKQFQGSVGGRQRCWGHSWLCWGGRAICSNGARTLVSGMQEPAVPSH